MVKKIFWAFFISPKNFFQVNLNLVLESIICPFYNNREEGQDACCVNE